MSHFRNFMAASATETEAGFAHQLAKFSRSSRRKRNISRHTYDRYHGRKEDERHENRYANICSKSRRFSGSIDGTVRKENGAFEDVPCSLTQSYWITGTGHCVNRPWIFNTDSPEDDFSGMSTEIVCALYSNDLWESVDGETVLPWTADFEDQFADCLKEMQVQSQEEKRDISRRFYDEENTNYVLIICEYKERR